MVIKREFPEFEINLKIKNKTFLAPLIGNVKNCLLDKTVDEFTDDIIWLNQQSETFKSGSDRPKIKDEWNSAPAQFYDSQLIIDGQQVMGSWASPLMKAMAENVTQIHGDVLEVGFGMGISATCIQEFGVNSHTIIECNNDVFKKSKEWKLRYPDQNIRLIHSRWEDAADQLETYDGIFFDTYPVNEDEFAQHIMPEMLFSIAATCLRKGGKFTYFSNEIDSLSRQHQRMLLKYFSSFSLTVLRNLNPPEDSYYWWADSMVVVTVTH